MRRLALLLAIPLVTLSCGGEPQGQSQTQVAPDSTSLAQAAYDPTLFDTITWKDQAAALERGKVVYQFSCLKCHGETGLGDAAWVRGGDTLHPPSFRAADWPYAQDKDGLRRQVFVGTAEGMPHWGLVGLKPRDLEGVAIYIIEGMRRD
jgi:mono/diheme cytochrome c family protein